ncbi:MAG: hypothetical protein RLZZ306_1033 [Bacteroidota bacterium]|jgi:hypothetical protein
MSTIIIEILNSWNGVFFKRRTLPENLKPLYHSIKERRFITMEIDKVNLNSDFFSLKKDMRKTLDHYYKNGKTK